MIVIICLLLDHFILKAQVMQILTHKKKLSLVIAADLVVRIQYVIGTSNTEKSSINSFQE